MPKNNLNNNHAGWQESRLDDCLTIKHGKSQQDIEVLGGKYPILASGGIIGWTDTPLYSKPSVLIGRKGTIDRPQFMDSPFWTVDTLFYSQVKNDYSAKYLYYLFITINWKKYSEQSGLPSLSAATISSIKVKIPLLAEQNRIVAILETWDKVIEQLTKKIQIKRAVNKVLIQELLTGKKRLSGFNDSWETIKLEDIANFRRGSFPQPYGLDKWYDDSNGAPFVQVYDVGDNFKLKENTKRKISSAAQKLSVYVPKGSIVITIQGSIGRIAITNYDAFLDRTLLFFQSFKKPMNKVFFMHSVFLLFEIEKNKADGGTIKTITKETLNKFIISIASFKEQNKIAEILITAEKEINELEKKLSIITDQKKYLLNNLITGKIRTPENLEILNQVQDDKTERD